MCHAEYRIADEIADVELLLEQIKYLLGNEREVRERKLYKLDRTEQRLLESFYEFIQESYITSIQRTIEHNIPFRTKAERSRTK